MDLVSLRSFLC